MKKCLNKLFVFLSKNWLIICLIIIAILSFIDLKSYLWKTKLFINPGAFQNFLLLLAFEAASYYAYITYKMWKLNKDPVLRIQWNDLGRDNYFKQMKADKEFLYNTYTDLQIVNDGNGSARDLLIEVESTCSKELPRLRNVTSIGPSGSTQLRYEGWQLGSNRNREFNNEDRSYAEPFQIIISYTDSQGSKQQNVFIVDENYNDGFKILK
ncbi:MAG: hypothetical protein PHR39_01050 [Actinomycetota bacterium]|nr:hypothetical protein [Actinomycetota bacterium]